MELNLSPRAADVTVAKTDGGVYYAWSGNISPVLSKAKLGAGKLVLQPRGFALPHFADCDMIGFVVQGSVRVGIVLQISAREDAVIVKKGDVIPVYDGAKNTHAEIVFLGETSKTYISAQLDYYFLTGELGVLGVFNTDFISQAFDLRRKESEKLVESQSGELIIKLPDGRNLPEPSTINGAARPDIFVNRGGSMAIADAENADAFGVRDSGFSACLVKLEANSMLGPINLAVDSATQTFYVLKGSGRVQVSGLDGKNALDANLKEGDLFVVPRFFVSTIMSGGEGLQCFLLLTSSQASFLKFSGVKSVWNAVLPSVLQAALNVDLDWVEFFKTKIGNGNIIAPPKRIRFGVLTFIPFGNIPV